MKRMALTVILFGKDNIILQLLLSRNWMASVIIGEYYKSSFS